MENLLTQKVEKEGELPQTFNIYDRINEANAIRQEAEGVALPAIEQAKALEAQGDPVGANALLSGVVNYVGIAEQAFAAQQKLRQELEGKISSGDILFEPQFGAAFAPPPTTNEEMLARYQRAISEYLGAPVDLGNGAGFAARAKASFLQPHNKEEFYRQEEGVEDVFTMNVGGSPTTMLKMQDGSIFPADEFDFSARDFADAIGETLVVGASVPPTIVASGTGSPLITALTGATAHTVIGTAVDRIAADVLNVELATKDAFDRRFLEGAIGGGIEYGATKLIGPALRWSSKVSKGTVSPAMEGVVKAQAYFDALGIDDLSPLYRVMYASPQERVAMQRIADKLPNYFQARQIQQGVERLQLVIDDAVPKEELPNQLYRQTIRRVNEQKEGLVRYIAMHDQEAAKLLKSEQSRVAQAALVADGSNPARNARQILDPSRQTEQQAADYLRTVLSASRERAKQAVDATYTPFFEKADKLVSVDPDNLASALEREFFNKQARPQKIQAEIDALRQRKPNAKMIEELEKKIADPNLPDSTRVLHQREVDRLRELSGPLNASQMDERFKLLRELGSDEPAIGANFTATGRAKERTIGVAQEFRDDVYRNTIDPATGKPLYDEWSNATKVYQNFLQYDNNKLLSDIVGTIGEDAGSISNRQLMNRLFQDPANVERLIQSVKTNDPTSFGPLVNTMKESYLRKIGLNGRQIGITPDFQFDEGIVRALYGAENRFKGEGMVQRMRSLQTKLKELDVNPSKITAQDVQRLEGALSTQSQQDLLQTIAQRERASKALRQKVDDIILRDAERGHKIDVARGEMPQALFSAPPDRVKRIMSKFGTEDQAALRKEYADHFFALYPNAADTTLGNFQLFNGPKFLQDIARNPKIEANMRVIMGDRFTDTMKAAAELVPAAQKVPYSGMEGAVGGIINQSGPKAHVRSGPVAEALGDRFGAFLYRAGTLNPTLESLAKASERKTLTPSEYNKVLQQSIAKSFMGLRGIKGIMALTETGLYDPEYSYEMGRTFGVLSKDALEYHKEFGAKRSPRKE